MERINIAEILKDCPKGMELDCTIFDDVHFDYIDDVSDIINCYIQDSKHKIGISFSKYGCYSNISKSKCVIFPKGKTTWEGFHRPFKDGDICCVNFNNYYENIFIFKEISENNYIRIYVNLHCNSLLTDGGTVCKINDAKGLRFATEEEKEKLFDAIKENGYRWNAETKTLEELKKEKFDISTLKPFDKVLIRDTKKESWKPSFFGFMTERNYSACANGEWIQCIPFENNEHLLGTTDDCDEFYKTWE